VAELAAEQLRHALKEAVIKVGGRKLKSGVQIYEGVAVPASWAADGAAASARAA
jgi:hypothetical protein